MRKKQVCTLVLTVWLTVLGLHAPFPAHAHPAEVQPVLASSQESDDFSENLQDTLLTLLTPAIDQAVKDEYGEPKQFDLFNAKIESIGRPYSGGFHFIIKVTIQTFEGAHNPPYGKDTFTFDITPEKTTLLKSKHTEIPAQL